VLQKEDYDKQNQEANQKVSKEEQNALNTLARQIVESDMDEDIVTAGMNLLNVKSTENFFQQLTSRARKNI